MVAITTESPSPPRATICRASAGSGKTFALVKAYLKLVLLDPSRYHRVLAITFTNDATGEMKQRILTELGRLAAGKNSDMRQAILADFEQEGVERIKDVLTGRAGRVLNSLLHDYDRFHISTIDAFFAQLVRHLARELKLNLSFELDVDTGRALDEAVEQLFATATPEVLDWLEQFVLHKLEEDKGWHIRHDIAALGNMLFRESYLEVAGMLEKNTTKLKTFIEELQARIGRFESRLKALGEKGLQIAAHYRLKPADFKAHTFSFIEKLARGRHRYTQQPSATFARLAEQPEGWHRAKDDHADIIRQAVAGGLARVHRQIMAMYEQEYGEYLEARALLQHIYSYGLLSVLAGKLRAYRQTQNLVFVSDIVFILRQVIHDRELPFIYEKMAARFGYILVDEFQDTSRLQWKNLLPFIRNALDEGGQLLLVGDVKQSIYRWRGGDMELLLHQVERDLPEAQSQTLDTNYRSGRQIVAFNNAFFRLAPRIVSEWEYLQPHADDLLKAYRDVEQKAFLQQDGYVEILFRPADEVPQNVLATVRQALDEGYRPGDILLLTRSNKESAALARHLIENGVKVVSEQALQVQSSPKVQLVVQALRYLLEPGNLLALAHTNFFYREVTGRDPGSLTAVPAWLEKGHTLLRQRPVYEVLEELIIRLGIPQPGDIYLQHLLDLCLTRAAGGEAGLADFLAWWDEELARPDSRQFTVSLPDDENTVKAMTVHKAKGLQARVVLVPYAGFDMKPRAGVHWFSPLPEPYTGWGTLPVTLKKELRYTRFAEAYGREYFKDILESLNILYVAFTRPVERLHILVDDAKTVDKQGHCKENAAGLIRAVLENPGFAFAGQFDSEAGRLVVGNRQPATATGRGEARQAVKQKYAGSGLVTRLEVNQQAGREYLLWSAGKQEKLRQGMIIHRVLAAMDNLTQLDKVLNRQWQAGLISAKEKTGLKAKIEALFMALPVLHDWFGPGYEVLAERRLVAAGKTYVPDRVMLRDGRAVVVDFKLAAGSDKYRQQVRNYGRLLEEMGYHPVEKYLLFVDTQTLEKVT